MTEAQRLAALIEVGAQAPTNHTAAAELRRLEAECEQLKKANALLQQHHATAWNRGHEMGMMANRQIASEAIKAVASDAWDNTRLTEALMASEAECEQIRADAARYRWLRQGDNDEQVMRFHEWATEVCVDPPPMYLPRLERLDRYIDAAIAKETK